MAGLQVPLFQGVPAGQQPAAAPGAAPDFRRIDRDGDGRVSYQEFAFATIDRDGDGTISYDEYAAYLAQQGRQQGPLLAPGQPPAQMGMPPAVQAGANAFAGAMGGALGGVVAGAAQPAWGLPVMQGVHGTGGGMERLATQNRLEIKERPSIVEEVTAMFGAEINMANMYDVLDVNGQVAFQAMETTSAGDRQCQNWGCCADCAAWEVKFAYMPPGAVDRRGWAFLRMHRDWQCSCCCIKRPIAHVENLVSGRKVGHFRDPYTCGRLKFDVQIGEEEFHLNGGWPCCQCGWCCPLPCGPCAKIKFDVEDADTNSIATIERNIPNAGLWWAGSSVDNYTIDYQNIQDVQKKAMIMALAIFMDFRYFNKKKKQESRG